MAGTVTEAQTLATTLYSPISLAEVYPITIEFLCHMYASKVCNMDWMSSWAWKPNLSAIIITNRWGETWQEVRPNGLFGKPSSSTRELTQPKGTAQHHWRGWYSEHVTTWCCYKVFWLCKQVCTPYIMSKLQHVSRLDVVWNQYSPESLEAETHSNRGSPWMFWAT